VAADIVEYHSFVNAEQTLGSLLDLLSRNGFRYYVQSPLRPMRPFRGPLIQPSIDLLANVFAWRP